MKHYTIPGYVVEQERIENEYYALAEKFIKDNDNFYVPRLIKYLITVDDAKVCLNFPATAEEIAEKMGWPLEKVQECIKDSIVCGVAHRNWKNGKVAFATSIVNIGDFTACNWELVQSRFGIEFLDLLKQIRTSPEYIEAFTEDLNSEKTQSEGEDGKKEDALFRILPRYEAIKNIPGVMPCENLKFILEEQEYLSTTRCMCRNTFRNEDLVLEGSGKNEEGHCIKFNDAAKHFVEEMGVGRYMTAEEIMDNLDKVKDTPLYHMIGNSRVVLGGFCNCCDDCCDMKMEAKHLPNFWDGIMPSRFLAKCDEDECLGCGHCADLCQFDAWTIEDDKAKIDEAKCMGCGACVVNCPAGALSMYIARTVEWIPENGPQHIQDSLNLLD